MSRNRDTDKAGMYGMYVCMYMSVCVCVTQEDGWPFPKHSTEKELKRGRGNIKDLRCSKRKPSNAKSKPQGPGATASLGHGSTHSLTKVFYA